MRGLLIAFVFAFAGASAAQNGASELDRAYDEMLAAHLELQQAEAARKQSVEPLQGERLGTASGQSRLSDEYWERQKRLEEDVALARKRLDQALVRWNAVR